MAFGHGEELCIADSFDSTVQPSELLVGQPYLDQVIVACHDHGTLDRGSSTVPQWCTLVAPGYV